MIVKAKVIAHAFDSKNAIQFFPGDTVELDFADKDQRKLVWLRTPRGKWIFEFDRANSSDPQNRMFFCKECGEPFNRLSELGTHTRSEHNKNTKIVKSAQQEAEDEEEEILVAEALRAQQATEQP